jgi:hypothetical protein
VITRIRRYFSRRRIIRAFQLDLGWSRRKSTIFVDAMLAEYGRVVGTQKETMNVPNHDRIRLPRALVPRGTHEQYSRSSLTLATLRALELGAPIETSLAGCISQYREFFYGIPELGAPCPDSDRSHGSAIPVGHRGSTTVTQPHEARADNSGMEGRQ